MRPTRIRTHRTLYTVHSAGDTSQTTMMSLYISGSKGAQIIGNQNLDAVNLRLKIEDGLGDGEADSDDARLPVDRGGERKLRGGGRERHSSGSGNFDLHTRFWLDGDGDSLGCFGNDLDGAVHLLLQLLAVLLAEQKLAAVGVGEDVDDGHLVLTFRQFVVVNDVGVESREIFARGEQPTRRHALLREVARRERSPDLQGHRLGRRGVSHLRADLGFDPELIERFLELCRDHVLDSHGDSDAAVHVPVAFAQQRGGTRARAVAREAEGALPGDRDIRQAATG
mmetsp:Transcript_3701/g.17033  ORF Transcript_3701/g.17033 Transcript_3701/m.17033 type:complete len:282 (-) Transcript_3701:1725-2570(-)